MERESTIMKAFREFAMADPNNCDREWEACLALGRDKATASGSSPTNSTSSLSSAAATTSASASLRAPRDSALAAISTAPAASRVLLSTTGDLSPEARRVYDYLVGSSAPPSSTTTDVSINLLVRMEPAAVQDEVEELAAPTPSTCSTICLGDDTSVATTPPLQTAVPASPESTPALPTAVPTMLPSPTEIEEVQDVVDLDAADLVAPAPTACSMECPSHDASASAAALMSCAIPNWSATTGDINLEPAVDLDLTGDGAPSGAICLPGSPDQNNFGEDLMYMSVTLSSTPMILNSLPGIPRSSPRAPMDIQKLFMQSTATCSTIRSGCSLDTPPNLLAKAYRVFNDVPMTTTIVPWPPPFLNLCTGIQNILQMECQQKSGKEFLVEDSKGKWDASWNELSKNSHLFERMKVVKLKPPWPPSLGVCTNLPMGILLNLFGFISVNDNSSPYASWCLDDVLWAVPKCWPDLSCAQPCWPDPPWPPTPLNMNRTCIILNLHGTLDNMELSGGRQVLETCARRLGAVPIVVILVPGVQKAELKPTVFKWSCLLCFDIQFLSSCILDVVLVRRAAHIVRNWCCLNKMHCSFGKTTFSITDWVTFQWVLLNYHLARVQIQWKNAVHVYTSSRVVRRYTSFSIFLAIFSGEPEVQRYCSCTWVLTDIVCKGWIHCQFLGGNTHCFELQSGQGFEAAGNVLFFCCAMVQWKNHWKNILVSLQFRFQCCRARREYLCISESSENFQWTIAWLFSYQLLNIIELTPWSSWELILGIHVVISCLPGAFHILTSSVETLKGIYPKYSHYFEVQKLSEVCMMFTKSTNLHAGESYWLLVPYSSCDKLLTEGATTFCSEQICQNVKYNGLTWQYCSYKGNPYEHHLSAYVLWYIAWLLVKPSVACPGFGGNGGLIMHFTVKTMRLQPTKVLCCILIIQCPGVPISAKAIFYAIWQTATQNLGVDTCGQNCQNNTELPSPCCWNEWSFLVRVELRGFSNLKKYWDPGGVELRLSEMKFVIWLVMPWDPGGSMWCRLEVKPKFKRGGLSATWLHGLGDGPPHWAVAAWEYDAEAYIQRKRPHRGLAWNRTERRLRPRLR